MTQWKRKAAARARHTQRSDAGGTSAGPLGHEPVDPGTPTTRVPKAVHALSGLIRDLEEQLDRMMSMNEAVKKDLAAERARRVELEFSQDELGEQLRRAERDAAAGEDLMVELGHLRDERSRLAREADVLQRQLDTSEQQRRNHDAVHERMRASRADALEDLQTVESQFERAMRLVADLRARVEAVSEGHDTLQKQLLASEDKLRQVARERDALQIEVEESRTALDDIRQSLVDACATAPRIVSDKINR